MLAVDTDSSPGQPRVSSHACAWCLQGYKDQLHALVCPDGDYPELTDAERTVLITHAQSEILRMTGRDVSHGICKFHKDQVLRSLQPAPAASPLVAA